MTIIGQTPNGGQANVTINGGPSFVGFTIGSSGDTISALTVSNFGTGVDIDPPPLLGMKLATHETFADNTVSDVVMSNIEQYGVIMGSMFLAGCGTLRRLGHAVHHRRHVEQHDRYGEHHFGVGRGYCYQGR